ncbi:hypothetical protein ACFOEE_17985 [Pseudoalteromonas fenneropenaei]|uniref:Uncharacterized protein n=1 Tax=Pseudoalteromonas fenneropenaei TaxID=1737459 RepID=A0ABV7CPB2_9GAMM
MRVTEVAGVVVLLTTSSVLATQLQERVIDNANPFEQAVQSNPMVAPKGLVSYSFQQHNNPIVTLDTDQDYRYEALQTKMFGRAFTELNRVADLPAQIKTMLALQTQKKAEFIARQLKFNNIPNDVAERRYRKMTAAELTTWGEVLPDAKVITSYGAGTYIQQQGWDTAVNILDDKHLGNLIIERWHYKASDGGVLLDSDTVNITIKDNPGIFIVRNAGERVESVLSWVDEASSFTVRSDVDLGEGELKAKLITLAEFITTKNLPNAN